MLVGLSGKARSGKDTAASVLVEQFGFKQLAFADALKAGCAAMLNLPLERMYHGDREAELPGFGFSIRHFLQVMGTECVRQNFGGDFWIKSVRSAMQQLRLKGQTRFVVSDVRFDNEATWVRQNGGKVVCIERDGNAGTLAHASEKGIWRFPEDSVLHNNATYEEFRQAVTDWAAVNVLGEELA